MFVAILAFNLVSATARAQTPLAAQPRPAGGPAPAYPTRPAGDPAKIAHGQQLFGANCAFCHGNDARGGETGPNLVRSELILNDQHAELITPVVRNGRLDKGMPAFQLSENDIADIAEFIHSQPLNLRGRSAVIDILVGDADAGKAYFNGAGKCNTCHSPTGDLAGIGSRMQPKALQNAIVAGQAGRGGFGPPPGGAAAAPSKIPPTTVTVTLANGEKVEGKLITIDAFDVSLTTSDGSYRSYALEQRGVKAVVHNPLQAHIDMLTRWTDTDIHNVTKYLSSLK